MRLVRRSSLVLIVAIAVAVTAALHHSGGHSRLSRVTVVPGSVGVHPASPAGTLTNARPFLGADGVVAPWVVAENRRPGTRAWQIAPSVVPDRIAGFANLDHAKIGDVAKLYVHTSATGFTVTAYRMGWYHGLGARAIWSSSTVPGHRQPACRLTRGINLVSCANWTASLAMPITKAFVPGDYLLKLTGADGGQGYIPLTVWDPASHATYLLINRVFTEVGWNAYGGFSFYQGTGPCPAG